MTSPFQLLFALIKSAGGTGSFTAPRDLIILTLDCDAAVELSFSPTVVYQDAVADNLFLCTSAGKYDVGLPLKLGQLVYSARSGLGAYNIVLGYQNQTVETPLSLPTL